MMKLRWNIRFFVLCVFCTILGARLATFSSFGAAGTATNSLPPPLPSVKAPIEYFRQLLALSPEERERALADRTESQKKVLLQKIREYEAMSAEERDLRLGVTELRWYLMPLMKLAPSERAGKLDAIPVEKRPLIEERLRRWDALSASQQKEFLDNEMTILYFLRLQSSTPAEKANLLASLSPTHRQKVQKELQQWESLPVEQRDRMCSRFQQLFELDPKERAKTLSALSESERIQMEKTLQTFQRLPPDQRRHCIESFGKFASMSAEERKEFLIKAEMWQKMSPADREDWRALVHQLPQMPPLPPGLKVRALPPTPPMPPQFPR